MDIPFPVRSLKISKEWPLLNPQTKRLLEIGQNNTPPLSSLCSLDIYKHPVHGSAITAAKNRVITYLLILVCVNDPCLKESCRQDTLNMSTFAARAEFKVARVWRIYYWKKSYLGFTGSSMTIIHSCKGIA